MQYFTQGISFSLLLFCLIIAPITKAQKVLEILSAEDLYGFERNGEKIKQLRGNVVLKQDDVMLFCDSAEQNEKRNTVDAYGHIKVQQGDSLTVTGDFLKYDGNTRVASIRRNVILIQPDLLLTTDQLDYDTKNKTGRYTTGGKLISGENTLTSQIGYYFTATKIAYFKKNVVLSNIEYTLRCDTLKYNSQSNIAYFLGPTSISKDNTTISCENGWYDRRATFSQFTKNVEIKSPGQVLKADSMSYNTRQEYGNAYRNILLIDSNENFLVKGNFGSYDRKKSLTKISNKALASQIVDGDSMFVHADTLYYYSDTTAGKKLYGYHRVKIYKSDMQGICDSLKYDFKDSVISFYSKPVLWMDSTQIIADTIFVLLKNQQVHNMLLRNRCFIASMVDTQRYNQIKGKNMQGFFFLNSLRKVKVYEQGESIYFAKDEKDAYLGVNKISCQNMVIYIDENKVRKINFQGKPDATFFPIKELPPSDLLLKGFEWKYQLRPTSGTGLIN